MKNLEKLSNIGLRATPCRLAVLKELQREGRPIPHSDLEKRDNLKEFNRVTLYRTLGVLEKKKLVHSILGIDGVWYYCLHSTEQKGCPGNHAHFICRSCGKMICLGDQPIPAISVPEGCSISGKQLLAYGICSECNEKRGKNKMDILNESREKLRQILKDNDIALDTTVTARALGISESLGDPAPYKDFALQKGVEKLMDIEINGAHGQAFTSCPAKWTGTLEEILELATDKDRDRALLIGTINATTRLLKLSDGTVHCKDKDPDECGINTAQKIKEILGESGIVGIIGYQPALLKHIVATLGADRVRITDLNPDNIGMKKFGVTVWDGEADLNRLAQVCDLGFATGSSLANGSTEKIIEAFKKHDREVIFFGTTIAGPASLLNLKRICPLSC